LTSGIPLSVGIGLRVLAELMEEEVDEVVGPKGRHDPSRVAVRHGHEAGEVTLGGRRVAVKGLSRLGCSGERSAGFLEGDEAGGELEEGEVVLVFLAPADEDAAVSVQPGVGRLDDPSPGAPAGCAGLELDLLAACAGCAACSPA